MTWGTDPFHALAEKCSLRAEDIPKAECIGRETTTFSLFPEMSDGDADRVVRTLRKVLRG